MATQALDTNDMQQSTVGRTINTATRVPQALLDKKQYHGQSLGFQSPNTSTRPIQQSSGGSIGQFYRNEPRMPVYSSQQYSALPKNASDWNNSQWASYFAKQGPSNLWNQETWDMFNMVTTNSPIDFNKWEKGLSMDREGLFSLNRDPGWVNIYSPEYRGTASFADKRQSPLGASYGQRHIIPNANLTGRVRPATLSPDYVEWNPQGDMWNSAQTNYNREAASQMGYELSMQKAYNALENYASQKAEWDAKNPGTTFNWYSPLTGNDASKFNYLKTLYTTGSNRDVSLQDADSFDRFIPLYSGYSLQPNRGPMSLEEIKRDAASTPLLDLGYTQERLPQYNPSFTVEGAKDMVESGKPWVSTYVKQAEAQALADNKTQGQRLPDMMNQSAIQGMTPQAESMTALRQRRRAV